MSRLEDVIAHGNRPKRQTSQITCADGFSLSVIAGGGTYCTPRPAMALHGRPVQQPDGVVSEVASDYAGPYSEVECGFPSARPEPWACPHRPDEISCDPPWCDRGPGAGWQCYSEDESEPTRTVYAYVPVAMVRDLVAAHGGES